MERTISGVTTPPTESPMNTSAPAMASARVRAGVSAAALWQMRLVLDKAGFAKARIVASSGFGPEKCRMMAAANAPINAVGTGSYLPEAWRETYATADIIAFDGKLIASPSNSHTEQ